MNNPKIAIIIPAYNAGKMIERCLNSLLYQTFEDFIVIIVNDGSSDDTLSVADSFAKKDSRFKVITQDNKGASVARNTGYANSVSEFVTFVDADDLLTPDALEHLYWHINRYNNDYVIGAKKKITSKSKTRDFFPEMFEKKINSISSLDIKGLKKIRFHIAPHAKLIRRAFLEKNKILFIEHWTYEDFLYSYTLLLNATSIGVVTHNCYYYISNDASISNTPLKKHNIISRWEIEKLLWELCSKKDPEKLIYGDPQATTFNTRLYRHISKIGLNNDTLHKDAFYTSKKIIKENINIIKRVTSGIKKSIYLAIHTMEFDEFYEFKQETELLASKPTSLEKDNTHLNKISELVQ